MLKVREIKKKVQFLAGTPLHPQWLIKAGRKNLIGHLKTIDQGQLVLDIGCFKKWPKKHLPLSSTYIGLDYLPTASAWYGSKPDVYADGCILPLASTTVDVVLLFDVCEHVAHTEKLFMEIHRVLKTDGRLIIQIPFLYPLHDEPRDYIRLTRHGFDVLAMNHGFATDHLVSIGQPCETSAVLSNLAISKTFFNWCVDRNPACILSILLPFIFLKNNILAKLISATSRHDEFMPYAYQAVLRKISANSV